MKQSIRLVVFHNDLRTASSLASGLATHFGAVNLVQDFEELGTTVRREGVDVLVLDVERIGSSGAVEARRRCLNAIAELHREFPALCIVATHRLADDTLWTEALNEGAADVCEPRNEQVIQAVLRERLKYAAAAA